MPAFIENPRRAPRIPIRCTARVALRSGGFFVCSTADVGPGGFGVAAAPWQLTLGERLFVEIDVAGGAYPLVGRVAWSSSASPWRCGIAFDEGSAATAGALLGRIAAEHPELAAGGRTIARIPEDAILARTPVPGSLIAVPGEARILLAVGDGLEARALPDRLGTSWEECVNALFALLERRALEARPRPGELQDPVAPAGAGA